MEAQMKDFRKKIDKLDQELLKVLAKRRDTIREIAKLKQKQGIQLRDLNREKEVLKKWKETAADLSLSENFVEKLFKLVIAESVKVQVKVQEETVQNKHLK